MALFIGVLNDVIIAADNFEYAMIVGIMQIE